MTAAEAAAAAAAAAVAVLAPDAAALDDAVAEVFLFEAASDDFFRLSFL